MNTQQPVPAEQFDRNYRLLVLDIFWFGLAMPSTARFLSVYAIRLGASAILLGWLAALPAIIALATSSLAGWWRRRYDDSVSATFWPGLLYRLCFLLPAFTAFFPHDLQPAWLLLAVGLPALAQGLSSVIFLVMLRESSEQSKLTALLSHRSLTFNIAVAVSTLAFGVWLEEVRFPLNYQMMYVVAFGLSLISWRHVLQVRVLNPQPAPVPGAAPAIRPWRSPAFRRVALIAVSMHVSYFSILAIIPLRLVDELGADEAFMSVFSVAEMAAAALMAALTNRIVQRIGSLATMTIGTLLSGVAAALLALAPSLWFTLIPSALAGGMWTMAAISLFGYFSDNTPPESLTSFSMLYNQIVMLSVFVGPMLGSQLASTSLDLPTVLLIGAILRLLAGGLMPFDILARTRRKSPAMAATPPVD
jgi:MFS family permease